MMVDVRYIEAEYALLQVNLRESSSDLFSLEFFHYKYDVSPGKLFFGYRGFIEQPCRPRRESAFEDFLCCLAPVQVLVADKQYFHKEV
jgi:hypothetical protein